MERNTKNELNTFNYIILKDGTIEITSYVGKDKEITIPYQLEGKLVTSIGRWAFSGCRSLEKIVIPNSIKYIGDFAFISCVNLCSIKLHKNIENISATSFINCPKLNIYGVVRSYAEKFARDNNISFVCA